MDMDISMDIQAKSVDMDMDGKLNIHDNPENWQSLITIKRVKCSKNRLKATSQQKMSQNIRVEQKRRDTRSK